MTDDDDGVKIGRGAVVHGYFDKFNLLGLLFCVCARAKPLKEIGGGEVLTQIVLAWGFYIDMLELQYNQ